MCIYTVYVYFYLFLCKEDYMLESIKSAQQSFVSYKCPSVESNFYLPTIKDVQSL